MIRARNRYLISIANGKPIGQVYHVSITDNTLQPADFPTTFLAAASISNYYNNFWNIILAEIGHCLARKVWIDQNQINSSVL